MTQSQVLQYTILIIFIFLIFEVFFRFFPVLSPYLHCNLRYDEENKCNLDINNQSGQLEYQKIVIEKEILPPQENDLYLTNPSQENISGNKVDISENIENIFEKNDDENSENEIRLRNKDKKNE
ncbi:hypothetical protein DMUE_0096 [Dictyocoela muelleri]|nr:hypothetical protein DMUE_0096 [Dictyocoela muelleri]